MKNWEDNSKVICITGSIGAGKSAVASIIESQGYLVIKSDDVARKLIQDNTDLQSDLIAAFGNDIFTDEKSINKTLLRDLLFLSKDAEKNNDMMDELVHPMVIEANINTIEEYYTDNPDAKEMVFIESALAIESGLAEGCDYLIQVSCKDSIADKRLLESRQLNQETIDAIRKRQLSQAEKERISDFTIHNDNSLLELEKSTMFIISLLSNLPPKFGRPDTDEEEME